jgi:hypothetical protein
LGFLVRLKGDVKRSSIVNVGVNGELLECSQLTEGSPFYLCNVMVSKLLRDVLVGGDSGRPALRELVGGMLGALKRSLRADVVSAYGITWYLFDPPNLYIYLHRYEDEAVGFAELVRGFTVSLSYLTECLYAFVLAMSGYFPSRAVECCREAIDRGEKEGFIVRDWVEVDGERYRVYIFKPVRELSVEGEGDFEGIEDRLRGLSSFTHIYRDCMNCIVGKIERQVSLRSA